MSCIGASWARSDYSLRSIGSNTLRDDARRNQRTRAAVVPCQEQHMPTEEHGHTVETAVEARAGFLDRPVAVVLIASIVAVVVGFALVYFSFFNA
jgi:hypothetical protein